MCNTVGAAIARTPLWQVIAGALRDEIAEGGCGLGNKLPTEAVLAGRFGVNRHTVRHALSALAAEGLVHTRRGKGSFVAARPTDYPIGARVRFSENLLRAGRIPQWRVLSMETRAATDREAGALDLAPGDAVLLYVALSLADGMPVALGQSAVPADRLPGLATALQEEEGLTAALARIGIPDYTRASTRIVAEAATATQALHLRIEEGAPVLRRTGITVDSAGVPLEYGRTWFAGDRVILTLGSR